MKIHYVSLLSEGPPHDNGLSLGHLVNNVSDIMSKYYDKVNVYTPKEIPVEHRKEYDGTIFETRYNPGYHNIGYGAFKPYLILKTLEETDCDIVVWQDSNIEKCPFYLEGLDQVKSLIEEVLNYTKTDIFIPFENPQWLVGHTTPSIVFETILGCVKEEYIGYPQMNAALVICKKTDYAKEIMKEWIKWMQHDEFFLKSQIRKHSFNMNCGDQGVLNVLIMKEIIEGRLPQGWPYLGYTQRRFIKNKIYRIINTSELTHNSIL